MSLLRLALGWIFFYQGIVAFTNPAWSLLPAIDHAQTFAHFYSSISHQPLLGSVSYVVKLLFVSVGALLILGLWPRLVAFFGIALMLFFYFPLLHFPHVGSSGYIVDEHIIYCIILAYLFVARTKEWSGLKNIFKRPQN